MVIIFAGHSSFNAHFIVSIFHCISFRYTFFFMLHWKTIRFTDVCFVWARFRWHTNRERRIACMIFMFINILVGDDGLFFWYDLFSVRVFRLPNFPMNLHSWIVWNRTCKTLCENTAEFSMACYVVPCAIKCTHSLWVLNNPINWWARSVDLLLFMRLLAVHLAQTVFFIFFNWNKLWEALL